MIITLDGFSSQGKSSVGKALAEALGLSFFSIGSLFRFLAEEYRRHPDVQKDPEEAARAAVKVLESVSVEEILSTPAREERAAEETLSLVTAFDFVYRAAAKKAKDYLTGKDYVVDGRFGFLLFPHAERRYYFVSSIERRCRLSAKSRHFTPEEARAYIAHRDSFEIIYEIPTSVKTVLLDRFSSVEEIVAFLLDDLRSVGAI